MENDATSWTDIIGTSILLGIALLFVLGIAIRFINGAFGIIEILWINITGRPLVKHFVLFPRTLSDEDCRVLHQHFRIYRSLFGHEKRVFEHRVARFMKLKEWEARGKIKLDQRKKVIISGIAVKLTFGLRRYSMPIFKKIIVFPGPFKNNRTGNIHKGEFNPARGHVAFSWKDLMEGLEDPNDNLHLGLHEFAHALLMELMKGKWADSYFTHHFNQVDRIIRRPEGFRTLSSHPYFREYAQTNKMEFFAVAVEHFFETPAEFKRQLPKLYAKFVRMFNIDPLDFN
ncbi:MAG: zinc-dependent peptidase [Cryomorphaceae bacterium]|nr:zinc-dependent peptidase [Cryomorphaceae bacterium]